LTRWGVTWFHRCAAAKTRGFIHESRTAQQETLSPMASTLTARIPAPQAGFARPCALRHGYVWLGVGSLGEFSNSTMVNTKPSTRWSRRQPE
jgi:hypothetical protein